MATKLFVGSLAYAVTDEQLEELFKSAGNVVSAKVIIDRDTGRSKGFGFVEMGSEDEAKVAIDTLNGKELEGRDTAFNHLLHLGQSLEVRSKVGDRHVQRIIHASLADSLRIPCRQGLGQRMPA